MQKHVSSAVQEETARQYQDDRPAHLGARSLPFQLTSLSASRISKLSCHSFANFAHVRRPRAVSNTSVSTCTTSKTGPRPARPSLHGSDTTTRNDLTRPTPMTERRWRNTLAEGQHNTLMKSTLTPLPGCPKDGIHLFHPRRSAKRCNGKAASSWLRSGRTCAIIRSRAGWCSRHRRRASRRRNCGYLFSRMEIS